MVSGHRGAPSAISWLIRGRGTAQSGTPGAVILAARTGMPAGTAARLTGAVTCWEISAAIGTSLLPAGDLMAGLHGDHASRYHPGPAAGQEFWLPSAITRQPARLDIMPSALKRAFSMNFPDSPATQACPTREAVLASRPSRCVRATVSPRTPAPAPACSSPSSSGRTDRPNRARESTQPADGTSPPGKSTPASGAAPAASSLAAAPTARICGQLRSRASIRFASFDASVASPRPQSPRSAGPAWPPHTSPAPPSWRSSRSNRPAEPPFLTPLGGCQRRPDAVGS